jgi:phosphonate transport system substrate-binding protein
MLRGVKALTFGMGPFAIGRAANTLRDRFAALFSDALGSDVRMVATKTYPELFQLIRNDQVQLAWLPPAVFLQALDQRNVTLLLRSVRPGGSQYHGVLFVPEESSRAHPEDLADCTVGWVDRQSCGGFLFPRLALIEHGINASEHFAQEYLFASHTAVVAGVAAGKVDSGATYMNTTADGEPMNTGWTDAGLDMDAMRPLLKSRPIPSDVICAAPGLGLGREQQIARALEGLHEAASGLDVLRGLLQADQLVPANLRDYDVVRAAQNVAFSRIRPTFPRIGKPPVPTTRPPGRK